MSPEQQCHKSQWVDYSTTINLIVLNIFQELKTDFQKRVDQLEREYNHKRDQIHEMGKSATGKLLTLFINILSLTYYHRYHIPVFSIYNPGTLFRKSLSNNIAFLNSAPGLNTENSDILNPVSYPPQSLQS